METMIVLANSKNNVSDVSVQITDLWEKNKKWKKNKWNPDILFTSIAFRKVNSQRNKTNKKKKKTYRPTLYLFENVKWKKKKRKFYGIEKTVLGRRKTFETFPSIGTQILGEGRTIVVFKWKP